MRSCIFVSFATRLY